MESLATRSEARNKKLREILEQQRQTGYYRLSPFQEHLSISRSANLLKPVGFRRSPSRLRDCTVLFSCTVMFCAFRCQH